MDKFNSDGVKIVSMLGGGGGGGITNINVSAGTTSNNLSNIVFSNSNNISFGLNGSTITASYRFNLSAGTTSNNLNAVTFNNSNGVSFGLNASTVTAAISAIKALGVSNTGNTAGDTGVSTGVDWVIAGTNNVTVSQSTAVGGPNTIWFSAAAGGGGGLTNINVSAGTTSNNLSNIVFSNSNNVSFGLNGSTITATVTIATSLTNIRVSAGTTSNLLSAITFSNSNGISFGIDASTITASHNAITSQTNQTLGLYATGDTTGQSSSSTFDARSVTFRGTGGNVSVGFSNSSVLISVTAGGGGGGANTLSWWNNISPQTGAPPATTNQTNSSRTLFLFPLNPDNKVFPGNITASTARMLVSVSASSASVTGQHTIGISLGIYRISASDSISTLSLINSVGSTWTNTTLASSALVNSYMGIRWLTFDSSQWSASPTFSEGSHYYGALIYSFSGISFNTFATFGVSWGTPATFSGQMNQASTSNTTRGFHPWQGAYTATTTAFPTSIHISQLRHDLPLNNWIPMIEFNAIPRGD